MLPEMNERMGVVIPVSSPNHVPDLLADVNREVETHGANVAIVLVDNGGILKVSNGALSVGGRAPLRLSHLQVASFGEGQDAESIQRANVIVLQPGENLGWRQGTLAGTTWMLGNVPDASLVAFANDDIRLSPDFFGVMERTYQSVLATNNDPRVVVAPLYDDAFAEQVPEYLGPAEAFPEAGRESWRQVGVVDGTFQLTSRRGAVMTVLSGLTDLGGTIPWISDKIIAMLCAAPLESLPFLQSALRVAGGLNHVDALQSPSAANLVADETAWRLLDGMSKGDWISLSEALNIGDGSTSRGITAVADGAYINHKRHATYIEDLRAQNPALRHQSAEAVFSAGMHQEGLRDESQDFARFKLGVAALANRLSLGDRQEPTPTRAVVEAITRAGDEPGAWAQVLKSRAFGGVVFGGFVEPAPEVRKSRWLQRNPHFQQRGVATPGVA
jgi:hypothetical protein